MHGRLAAALIPRRVSPPPVLNGVRRSDARRRAAHCSRGGTAVSASRIVLTRPRQLGRRPIWRGGYSRDSRERSRRSTCCVMFSQPTAHFEAACAKYLELALRFSGVICRSEECNTVCHRKGGSWSAWYVSVRWSGRPIFVTANGRWKTNRGYDPRARRPARCALTLPAGCPGGALALSRPPSANNLGFSRCNVPFIHSKEEAPLRHLGVRLDKGSCVAIAGRPVTIAEFAPTLNPIETIMSWWSSSNLRIGVGHAASVRSATSLRETFDPAPHRSTQAARRGRVRGGRGSGGAEAVRRLVSFAEKTYVTAATVNTPLCLEKAHRRPEERRLDAAAGHRRIHGPIELH